MPGIKSCLKGVAPDVTHVSSKTSTESESNSILSVDRNPDEFKHMRHCSDFPLGFLRT